MGRNLGGGGRSFDVVATVGSTVLKTGDVVTGDDLRNIEVTNGIVKVTYEAKTPDVERGAHTLYRWWDEDGDYVRAVSAQFGDWTYFVVGITSVCDQATIVEATENAVEIAFEWTALDLDSGIVYRDWNNALNYAQGAVNPNWKTIASTKFIKTIRVEREREGYFVGYHSDPLVGPVASRIPDDNNETAFGEREVGTGSGNRVFFTSAGVSCLHPDWGDDDRGWVAAGFTGGVNRPCWGGIDDATYAPYNAASFIALQASGFPAEQNEGPWWAADLHYTNIVEDAGTRIPFCRYLCLRERYELGSWQFGESQYGCTVCHFVNESHDDAGVPHRFQVFVGATPYVSSDLVSEPTGPLRGMIQRKAESLVWPVNS